VTTRNARVKASAILTTSIQELSIDIKLIGRDVFSERGSLTHLLMELLWSFRRIFATAKLNHPHWRNCTRPRQFCPIRSLEYLPDPFSITS